MKKLIGLVLIALIGLSYADSANAGERKKKKQQPSSTVVAKSLTPYEKLFKGKKVESAPSKFITLHKVDGKLFVEMPLKYMNRDMLIASTLSETSDSFVGVIGYKAADPVHVRFTMKDSSVCLITPNVFSTYDETNVPLSKAIKKTSMAPVKKLYKVAAYSSDSTAVVFDMTDFFAKDNIMLPVIPKGGGMISIKATPNNEVSSLGAIKAFSDNVVIKSELGYMVSVSALMGLVNLYSDMTVSTLATRTILLLPEKPMTPRYSDNRVGIFLTYKNHFSDEEDMIQNYSVAHRWRLEPKDVAAYERGELVEPVTPILFYIDNAFPELWQEPLKVGIERWNKAFEKIGFKNAIKAVPYPTNAPDFDPDNLKYSCIRYVPSDVPNAMGPSWVDPRSGEIVNATVIIYSNITKLINNWRFVQTAQIDPRVRAKKMPESIMKESMAYVVAHEIGHTLGYMHNMSASAVYPVDSLRSVSFTAKNGTTTSIMDYARFNYVAQPGDGDVALTPPDLGEYDYFLTFWNYKYYGDTPGAKEEAKRLEKVADSYAGNKTYHYGRQQIDLRIDPRSLEEDLGDDAIKAGEYGIKNLKYIFANLDKWIDDDPDGKHKALLTDNIVTQYARYINNVTMNVGGVYLDDVKEGTPGQRYEAVPRDLQKKSMKWIFKQLRDIDWLDDSHLSSKRELSTKISLEVFSKVIPGMVVSPTKVLLSSHISKNPYSVKEYYDDLYNELFASTIAGRPLTQAEMYMQREFMNRLFILGNAILERAEVGKKSLTEEAYGVRLNDILLYGLDENGFADRYKKELENIQRTYGDDFVTERLNDRSTIQFGAGYGWQSYVLTKTIDNSKGHVLTMLQKTRTLLKSRIATSDVETKAHYQVILLPLNELLKTDK